MIDTGEKGSVTESKPGGVSRAILTAFRSGSKLIVGGGNMLIRFKDT